MFQVLCSVHIISFDPHFHANPRAESCDHLSLHMRLGPILKHTAFTCRVGLQSQAVRCHVCCPLLHMELKLGSHESSVTFLQPFLHALIFLEAADPPKHPKALRKNALLHVVYLALQIPSPAYFPASFPGPNPLAGYTPIDLEGLTVGRKSFLPWGFCTRVLSFSISVPG